MIKEMKKDLKEIGFESAIISTHLITEADLIRLEVNNKIKQNYKQIKFLVIIKKISNSYVYTAKLFNTMDECNQFIMQFLADRFMTTEDKIKELEKSYKIIQAPIKLFPSSAPISSAPSVICIDNKLTLLRYQKRTKLKEYFPGLFFISQTAYALIFSFKGKYFTRHFEHFKDFIDSAFHFHRRKDK